MECRFCTWSVHISTVHYWLQGKDMTAMLLSKNRMNKRICRWYTPQCRPMECMKQLDSTNRSQSLGWLWLMRDPTWTAFRVHHIDLLISMGQSIKSHLIWSCQNDKTSCLIWCCSLSMYTNDWCTLLNRWLIGYGNELKRRKLSFSLKFSKTLISCHVSLHLNAGRGWCKPPCCGHCFITKEMPLGWVTATV